MRRWALLVWLSSAAAAVAAPPPGLVIDTQATAGIAVTDLGALPSTRDVAAYAGKATVAYDGPLLWAVLQRVRQPPGDMRAHAGHTITVVGADGYSAVLALAEIDPGLEGKAVILATVADGKPLALPRLVVPGDHAPARSVRDVVRLRLD